MSRNINDVIEEQDRKFKEVLEGDYLEPVRELKQERDELLEIAKEMLEVIEGDYEGSIPSQRFFKWKNKVMEVDNHE